MKKYYFIYLSIIATTYSMEDANNNNTQNVNTSHKMDYTFNISVKELVNQTKQKETIQFSISINPLFFKQRIKNLKMALISLKSDHETDWFDDIIINKIQNNQQCPNDSFKENIEKACIILNKKINNKIISSLETTIQNLRRKIDRDHLDTHQEKIHAAIAIYAFLDCIVKINNNPYLGVSSISYGPHLLAAEGGFKALRIFYNVNRTLPLDSQKQSVKSYVNPTIHSRTYAFLADVSNAKIPQSLQTIKIKNLITEPHESFRLLPQPWLENTSTQPEE